MSIRASGRNDQERQRKNRDRHGQHPGEGFVLEQASFALACRDSQEFRGFRAERPLCELKESREPLARLQEIRTRLGH